MRIATEVIQHSEAAAKKSRQNVYAAHATLGKATIWFTISPDDTRSYQVHYYAVGTDTEVAPPSTFRFNTLANHPAAAALNFAKVLKLVLKFVIGWNIKKQKPYKRGGYFGIPKAWLRVVEEQGRLTLHTHFLVWIYGHNDLHGQIMNAQLKDSLLITPTISAPYVLIFL